MKKALALILALAMALGCVQFALAKPAETATSYAIENAYSRSDQGSTIQNSDSELIVSSNTGAGPAYANRYGFFRFNALSSGSSNITEAKFLFHVSSATNTGERTMTLYPVTGSWDRATLTWNNQPSYGSAIGSVTIPTGVAGDYSIDITNYVKTVSGAFSLMMSTTTGANFITAVGGGTLAPRIEISYTDLPVKYSSGRVVTIDDTGAALAAEKTLSNLYVGLDFEYTDYEDMLQIGDTYYFLTEEESVLSFTTSDDASENVIKLVYHKADEGDVFSGYELAESGATCWFADPRSLHYENEELGIDRTYVGYIDLHGYIKATQYDHKTGEMAEVLIRSNFQPDDHDNPTFLALPDGRIMTFYSRHTDEACFYYRVTTEPGDITTFGPEKIIKTVNNTTYPSPFILSDQPNSFFLCWRGINWHPTIAQYSFPDANGDLTTIREPRQIVQSTGARPYAKYESNGKDRICVTYTTGHPDNEWPNWTYYNEIDVNNYDLYDVANNRLGNISSSPYNVNKTSTSGSIVVDNSSDSRNWVWDVARDKDGKPIIAMVKISQDKQNHNYYYVKWNGSSWTKTFLAYAGKFFHQSPNTENCYSGGMTIDHDNPTHFYVSMPIAGMFGNVFEIVEFVMNEDGTEILEQNQITKNSRYNNARPFLTRNAHDSELRLTWMNGLYYYWIVNSNYPNAFPTRIMTSYNFERAATDTESGVTAKYEFADSETDSATNSVNGNKTALNGAAVASGRLLGLGGGSSLTLDEIKSGSFTVSAMVKFDGDSSYGGRVYSLGGDAIKYEVWDETPFPVLNSVRLPMPHITINGTLHTGSSPISNSDWHKTVGSTTEGHTNVTNPGWSQVALVYDEDALTLTSYVDGLMDQKIALDGPMTLSGDSLLGGFDGYASAVYEYDRALNQEEVRALYKSFDESALDSSGIDSLKAYAAINIGAKYDAEGRIISDVVLPRKAANGDDILWYSYFMAVTSDNESSGDLIGIPYPTDTEVEDILCAMLPDGRYKEFPVTIAPRTGIDDSLIIKYTFGENDVYTKDGVTYVRDKSGYGSDAIVGGERADFTGGKLDITANTAAGWTTNGYLELPEGILKNLRSYTVSAKVSAVDVASIYRLYDFGSSSSNSLFARLKPFGAGAKYNGATTELLDAADSFPTDGEHYMTVTYDAASKMTTVYIDSEVAASGTVITREAYEIYNVAADSRNYVARSQWWDTAQRSNNLDMKGTVDNFRVYARCLDKDEVALLMTVDEDEEPIQNSFSYDEEANTAIATIVNDGGGEKNYTLIAASYNDGVLCEVVTKAVTIAVGGSVTESLAFANANDGNSVKLMVWDKINAMKPIFEAKLVK